MKLKKLIANPYLLIIISAVFSALPLTISELYLLSWISFVPLFYVIIKHSCDKLSLALGRGFLFGFIYYLFIYYWFCWFYPLDYAGLNNAASIAVVILASVGISIAHGALWCIPFIVCFIVKKINKNPLFLSFAAILSIMAIQNITSLSELSFPWVHISLGQYKATALIQSASLFGIGGMDFIILAVNALITIFIISESKKRIAAVVAAAVIFVSNLGFGLVRLNYTSSDREFKILTVQASVPQEDKWSKKGDEICFDAHYTLTKDNISSDVDLVIWPESAVPVLYDGEEGLIEYEELSKELGTQLLVGVLLDVGKNNTNNAVLIGQNGVEANYAKRQLVPFGEYMPYEKAISKVFPFLTKLNIIEDDYIGGNNTVIMQTENGKLGNIICFESIYPELCRQSTLDGAEILIETTNDSWLKDSPAMTQHLAHGVFRSIENSRYLVRSANSGISAVIDARGNIKSSLPIDYQGTLTDTVYFSDETTLYTKTGDILFPICCTCFVIISIVLFVIKIKNKKSAK